MANPPKKYEELSEEVKATPIGGLYPSPDGKGGMLRRGNPGNKGGGRRPTVVRDEIRKLLDETGLKELRRRFSEENIKKISHADLNRYLDTLGRYGLGTKQEISGPDDGPLSHGVLIIPGMAQDPEIPVIEPEDEEPSS